MSNVPLMSARIGPIAVLIAAILVFAAPALGRGNYIATFNMGPLNLYDAGTFKLAATIPIRDEVPRGVIVEDDGHVVVLSPSGLSVYSMGGTLIRMLKRQCCGDSVARLKPGWVAATFLDDVNAYSVDGKSVERIDSFVVPLGLRAISKGRLAVRARHEVRIYGGWPLKLQGSIKFADDITSIEPISDDVLAVATSPHGDQMDEPRMPPGQVTLFEYNLTNRRFIRKVPLEQRGVVQYIRRVGDLIAVYVNQCDTEETGRVSFWKPDLSRSNLKGLDVGGSASVTVNGGKLIIGVRSCAFTVYGSVWKYDPISTFRRKLFDGPYIAYEDNGT